MLRLILDNINDENPMLIKSINHMSIYAVGNSWYQMLLNERINKQHDTWTFFTAMVQSLGWHNFYQLFLYITRSLWSFVLFHIFLLLNSWCMKKLLMNKNITRDNWNCKKMEKIYKYKFPHIFEIYFEVDSQTVWYLNHGTLYRWV